MENLLEALSSLKLSQLEDVTMALGLFKVRSNLAILQGLYKLMSGRGHAGAAAKYEEVYSETALDVRPRQDPDQVGIMYASSVALTHNPARVSKIARMAVGVLVKKERLGAQPRIALLSRTSSAGVDSVTRGGATFHSAFPLTQ